MPFSHRMSELSEVYRAKLNAVCLEKGWISQKDATKGSPSELVRVLGRSSSFWSDRLSGRKPISTDLAYEIEDKLGLSRLALSEWHEPEGNAWPLSDELLAALSRLDADALRKAENVLRLHLDMNMLPRVGNRLAA